MITAAGRCRRSSASEYLQQRWGLYFTADTLANLAVSGEGPVYRLAGRYAVYADEDLDQWARTRISGPMRKASEARSEVKDEWLETMTRRSTSDAPAHGQVEPEAA
jgi:hypothetical protein